MSQIQRFIIIKSPATRIMWEYLVLNGNKKRIIGNCFGIAGKNNRWAFEHNRLKPTQKLHYKKHGLAVQKGRSWPMLNGLWEKFEGGSQK